MSPDLNPQPAPFLLEWPPVLLALQPILSGGATPVYLVGGAVRDALLRRPVHDLDFVTGGDGRRWARKVADRFGGAYYPLDAERGVGRAIIDHEGTQFVIDVARYRGASLADDLAGRDFTMNALAVPMNGDLQQFIDPLGGLADIQQKRLRQCRPASIRDDPVRALRAVRQSVALKLLIEPGTRQALHVYGPGIVDASPERVRDEFMNMLGGARPHVALRTLDVLGLLRLIVPEVEAMHGLAQSPPHQHDVWEHTLSAVEHLDGVLLTISPERTDDSAADSAYGLIVHALDRFRHPFQDYLAEPLPNGRSARALLMLAALLHDCAKPATRSVDAEGKIHFYWHESAGADLAVERATALRLSNEEAARLDAIIRHHMRPMILRNAPEVSRRAIYRFWNAAGRFGIDVCLFTLADYLGMVGTHLELADWIRQLQVVETLVDAYFNRKAELVTPPPLVTGNDVMSALALAPGPEVGRLLRLIGEAQAAGEVSTAEQALALAEKLHKTPEIDADE
jgi:poly(A) polymerase